MKGKFWRKALAVATSVLMLSGGVPIKPVADLFGSTAITAYAQGTEVNLSTLTGSYTAQDGEILSGTTSQTITIADDASITLNGVTITGGIVCNGTATITLVGTNIVNVSNDNLEYKKAGIQIGGSGTTLTIRGNGSLTATGGSAAAGIGLGRTWDASVTAGSIVIEGGTVTASGGIGIGIGTVGNSQTAAIDGISIKGGTVNASLGKGYLYYGVTATVGYIKVYDTIDMVDASKITETVTYMHGDDDVTANKTDYFTIGEDGERRIITPKDDTDYTITIADGIENGTITAAATAKYLETVTVTATPTFGYRLSRLIVKDADNNDIATNGNTFLMPKGNVTVSAEFALGSHGTTEFTWGYDSPGSFVNEATIYDGVTTVNIQQTGAPYSIRKYDGYTYSKFQLDNDNYDANIPYDGGTGEFYETGNGTNFRLPYDGETGYYDITMTDVGNGKWYVSFVKTAPKMDVVPDQTYTGSAITPEPLVVAGSLSLTKGTDYEYSYENNTDVGTATVRATFQGDYASLGYVEKEFTILPPPVVVNVTGNGTVTYNDKSAASGETIGVTAEKGTDVTLTLTPENGYAVRSVEYGYTNNSGTTASGFKLPVSGTTATLTVPNDLKDGTYVNLTVTFVSALAGGADEASAVALTDATVTDLGGGWYKVENDISFDHTLNLLADTYLTIAEGKTMSVNTTSGKAIDSEYTLNVSGEGALNITTTEAYKIAVRVGSYVQTGATVTANGYIGIRCMDNFDEFNVTNDFTFSGGQLTATGSGGNGIWADNDITLSCTNATDFIQASSYSVIDGTVKVSDGKMFKNGSDEYSGTLSNNEIKGKKLIPATKTLKLPTSITGGTLTADQSENVLVGDTVTLNVTPDAGYQVGSVSVNGTAVTPTNGVYSFTMPAEDVTVSAEFEELTSAYISGASLSLNGEISVNLFIKPSATLGEGAYVMVKGPNDTYAQKVMIDDSTYRADKQAYLISAPVYAAQMGEQVEFTLYNSADEPQKLWNTARTKSYDTYTYSVKNYIDKAKTQKDDNNVPTKLAVLAEKMENYGAWSTTYMLKTGKVDAGTALIATPTEITGITDETVEGKKIAKSNNCTVSGINVTLCLDSQTAIRLYYSGDEIKDISATRDGSAVTVNTGYSEEKQKYYVEIPNVAAQYLDDDYVVSFGDKGDVTVSGFSYVYLALKYSDDNDLKNVVRAIYEYNRAAEDFFVS